MARLVVLADCRVTQRTTTTPAKSSEIPVVVPGYNAQAVPNYLNTMSTPDNTQQPEQDIQDLTDQNFEEVSGGAQPVVAALGRGALGTIP
jgi:hypothetical protein